MKIKIKCASNAFTEYQELLKKYNPVIASIEYYSEPWNETDEEECYIIDIPSLAIIPELAEELQEDIIYRRAAKKGEDGYQEPYLLIYDDYIE